MRTNNSRNPKDEKWLPITLIKFACKNVKYDNEVVSHSCFLNNTIVCYRSHDTMPQVDGTP